jgi:hypothetical protein
MNTNGYNQTKLLNSTGKYYNPHFIYNKKNEMKITENSHRDITPYFNPEVTNHFVNFDGNVDYDLFTSDVNTGVISFYRNDGSNISPVFTKFDQIR